MLGSKFKSGRLSNFVQKAGIRRACKIYIRTGIYSQLVKLFSVNMRFNCMYYYNTCIYMTVIILDSLFKVLRTCQMVFAGNQMVQDLRQLENEIVLFPIMIALSLNQTGRHIKQYQ